MSSSAAAAFSCVSAMTWWKKTVKTVAVVILLTQLAMYTVTVKSEVAPIDPEQEAAKIFGKTRPGPGVMFDSGAGADAGTGDGPIGAAGTAIRNGDSDLTGIQAGRQLIDDHLGDGERNDTAKDGGQKGGIGNLGFSHSFIATLSVIVVSELGDKTFFIAAIMAMRHSRMTVFAGAMCALALMHVMSAFFGYAITVIPRVLTYYISSFLFAVFGLKMMRDGWRMSPNEAQEEMEEVQEDLRKREIDAGGDLEAGTAKAKGSEQSQLWAFISKIFIQAFTMTFLAEWGDRSQLATIVLAAREEITGVVLGGVLGHTMCTGLAVMGGRMIAQRISVRTVTIVGGAVFLIFAVTALFMDPEG